MRFPHWPLIHGDRTVYLEKFSDLCVGHLRVNRWKSVCGLLEDTAKLCYFRFGHVLTYPIEPVAMYALPHYAIEPGS